MDQKLFYSIGLHLVNVTISPKTDHLPYTHMELLLGSHRDLGEQHREYLSEIRVPELPSSQHTHALLLLWLWVLELNIKAHRSVGPNCHK